MISLVLYTCLLYGITIYGLPQNPAQTCSTPDPQPAFTEEFDGFNEPRDLCAKSPAGFTYRLSYDNWLNVDATALQPPAPILNTPQEPEKPILFAATPETIKSGTPTIAAYRDGEDQDTFDLMNMAFQCRSFCSNKDEADTTKCNQAAAPMECTFAVTCTSADGSGAVAQTFSYTPNDAKQNALKTIDFTNVDGKNFKNLAMCQFAATTPKPVVDSTLTVVLVAIFQKLLVILGLAARVKVFIGNSTTGTTFLIDRVTTAVTKCPI